MAVKRRLTGYSGMRLDWPHVRSIESSTTHDFDDLLRGLVTGLNRPYLIRGMNIRIPPTSIAASSLTVGVADSAVLHSSASEAGTILAVPAGTPDEILNSVSNAHVVGSFQNGAVGGLPQVNYVALDYQRISDPGSVDNTAGWSASQKLEFQRTARIGKILDYKFIISASGFAGMLPLWIIGVDSNGSTAFITNAPNNLFRLGSGGSDPDPQYVYDWGSLNNVMGVSPRQEWINPTITAGTSNPVTVIPGTVGVTADSFNFGDFAIGNLKDWMDAVMTRFREITGSQYWYMQGGSLNPLPSVTDLWWDSVGSVMTGTGQMSYNVILEATTPTDGWFQSQYSDPSILPGDSYIQGLTSGAKASITTFNATQLVVNSLSKNGFSFNEPLLNRRVYRPMYSQWALSNVASSGNLDGTSNPNWWLGRVRRKPLAPIGATPVAITSWASAARKTSVITGGNCVQNVTDSTYTITLSGPSPTFTVNQSVQITGAGLPVSIKNLYFKVRSVATHAITVAIDGLLTESFTAAGAVTDAFSVVTVLTAAHTFQPGDIVTVAGMSGGTYIPEGTVVVTDVPNNTHFSYYSSIIPDVTTGTGGTATPDTTIKLPYMPRFAITGAAQAAGPSTIVTLSIANQNFVTGQKILVSGLTVTSGTSPNGMQKVLTSSGSSVTFDPGVTLNGLAVGTAFAQPENDEIILTVSGASPDGYNVINYRAEVISATDMFYILSAYGSPAMPDASSAINLDGVVAVSTVKDPVRVSSLTPVDNGDGTTTITVITYVNHGVNPAFGVPFEIYGDSAITSMATIYANTDIGVTSPTEFTITFVGSATATSFVNTGLQNIFVQFSNNPYPGPVQWSSDIYVKGLVGDRYFVIPQTAVVDQAHSTPGANRFNINGLTGTAYLHDGEVAYIQLERNQSVSAGASFSTAGAGNPVVGAATPLDIHGNPLQSGDFVKFVQEDETAWMRISTVGSSFYLVDDHNQTPTLAHRPAAVGSLMYCKGTYDSITVLPHWQVDAGGDLYWLAVRRDNGSSLSRVYLKALELEAGEVRTINDNEMDNLIIYTGAGSESAVNPEYTAIDTTGSYQATQSLVIQTVDVPTRMVTFVSAPDLGFQKGDTFSQGYRTWTINQVVTAISVVIREDATTIALAAATYNRLNYAVADADNLTLAIRKEDRSLSQVNTAITRLAYDESAFVQMMTLHDVPSPAIRSGSFIYQGTLTAPTALAWVLHGSADISETIEGASINMPGGHSSLLPAHQSILIQHVSGTWATGASHPVYQNGSSVGTYTTSASFAAPAIQGSSAPGFTDGVELVLPPNRRAEVVTGGGGFVVFPTPMAYHASTSDALAGEELLVIVNDTIRQANVDYRETFGGPKGKILMLRTTPPNTRVRARIMASYGSALASKQAGVTLQSAYDASVAVSTPEIDTLTGRPLVFASPSSDPTRPVLNLTGVTSVIGTITGVTDGSFAIGSETVKPSQVWTNELDVKTHADHPGSSWRSFTCSALLNANNIITGSAIPLTDGMAYRIKVRATAQNSVASGNVTVGIASFTCEGTFYATAGVAYAAGSPITDVIGFVGDGASYALAFAISGNTVYAYAYPNGVWVDWVCGIDVQAVGPA